jgi:membrane-bound lytic murein transglycosylase D
MVVAQPADAPPTASYGCSGVYHVVRAGETIGSIARRYGSSAYRIAACNGLSSYTVYVGQTLLVPTAGRRGAWQVPPLPINQTK